jgi:predicted Zn-dependent protease with MMP-like domain
MAQWVALYETCSAIRIFIYRRPIERLCRTDDEVRERGRVIKHEIAHHFGLTDADLHNTSVS